MIFRTRIGKAIFRRFFLLIGKPDTARIPPNYFFTNWIFQRIFGVNGSVRFQVHFTSHVQGDEFMSLSAAARYSMAVSGNANIVAFADTKLEMGEGTIFARNVCIRTGNHDLLDRRKYHKADVIIGRNCWLAHGVAVMPGVTLGNNVTVGANAVVTKSFPDNVVIAGVPAKIIRHLGPDENASDVVADDELPEGEHPDVIPLPKNFHENN